MLTTEFQAIQLTIAQTRPESLLDGRLRPSPFMRGLQERWIDPVLFFVGQVG